MRAVVCNAPRDLAVKDVPGARIERPTYVLVRFTSTNIGGSDLHIYEGRTDFPAGGVFGHENLGQDVPQDPGLKIRSISKVRSHSDRGLMVRRSAPGSAT
jgi:threonine dehydrogenase-like Zn-dependent dehydrogenase